MKESYEEEFAVHFGLNPYAEVGVIQVLHVTSRTESGFWSIKPAKTLQAKQPLRIEEPGKRKRALLKELETHER